MILDKEPAIVVPPPGSIEAMRGTHKALLFDPMGLPYKGGHDDWEAARRTLAVKSVPGWDAEVVGAPPDPSVTEGLLVLTARDDGRAWPATVAKKPSFPETVARMAAWAASGRLVVWGRLASPSRLLRSQATDWDVAAKEQWAAWYDAAWPLLPVVGSSLERPGLFVGDEACWAFADPGDLVAQAKGLSPWGLASQMRGLLASRLPLVIGAPHDRRRLPAFACVNVCVGLAWAESVTVDQDWQEAWRMLCEAFASIAATLDAEGYVGGRKDDPEDVFEDETPWLCSLMEPPPCHPEPTTGAPLAHRLYARHLAVEAAKASGLPFVPLADGAWRDAEDPSGAMAQRHAAKAGCGPSPASRQWKRPRAGRS